jgi:hypothetical protein
MSVYVDDMNAKFGRMTMCHMIADSPDELHAMADKIGVARKWYQGDHYDICLSMKAKAIALGAVEVEWAELSRMTILRDIRLIREWKQSTGQSTEDEDRRIEMYARGRHPERHALSTEGWMPRHLRTKGATP